MSAPDKQPAAAAEDDPLFFSKSFAGWVAAIGGPTVTLCMFAGGIAARIATLSIIPGLLLFYTVHFRAGAFDARIVAATGQPLLTLAPAKNKNDDKAEPSRKNYFVTLVYCLLMVAAPVTWLIVALLLWFSPTARISTAQYVSNVLAPELIVTRTTTGKDVPLPPDIEIVSISNPMEQWREAAIQNGEQRDDAFRRRDEAAENARLASRNAELERLNAQREKPADDATKPAQKPQPPTPQPPPAPALPQFTLTLTPAAGSCGQLGAGTDPLEGNQEDLQKRIPGHRNEFQGLADRLAAAIQGAVPNQLTQYIVATAMTEWTRKIEQEIRSSFGPNGWVDFQSTVPDVDLSQNAGLGGRRVRRPRYEPSKAPTQIFGVSKKTKATQAHVTTAETTLERSAAVSSPSAERRNQ